jgi:hypothetical protein
MSRTVVPDVRTLKAMAKAGLIKLHADTGKKVRHWTGRMVTAFYVDGIGSGEPFVYKGRHYRRKYFDEPFVYKGRHYRLKYFDGCFSPFVVDIDFAKEIGVDLDAGLIV